MKKRCKLVVCSSIPQARDYLAQLPVQWDVSFTNLVAKSEDGSIYCRVYNPRLGPMNSFGCLQLNSVEFLTFDFGQESELVLSYIKSRLRSRFTAV